MLSEEIILAEREYLINVLHKKLIDSNEKDDSWLGYRRLAMQYWPEEFQDDEDKIVHHIDFNRSNNTVSNLVVLTQSEHVKLHYLFDANFDAIREATSKAHKGKKATEETRRKMSTSFKGRQYSSERNAKISEAQKGRTIPEERKQQISLKLKEYYRKKAKDLSM